jgi:TonB family protein
MAASHPTPAPPPAAHAATVLDFSGSLATMLLQPLPPFDSLREAEVGELRPARFLVGVSDHGEVRYVFLEDSSGDRTLDAAAGRAVEQARFRPSDAPYTWGFATFYWGSAVYAQPAPAAQ